MRVFDTYQEAHKWAQAEANASGLDFGLEKPIMIGNRQIQGWSVKGVPAAQYRSGWELRCEIVRPEVWRG